MGLMDKVKQQAGQALTKAQQGVSQGQAKIGDMQSKRQADFLLRNLGAAYYAEQREGGSADAVSAALTAVDEHAAAHGGVDSSPSTNDPPSGTASPAPDTPSGNFTLEDV